MNNKSFRLRLTPAFLLLATSAQLAGCGAESTGVIATPYRPGEVVLVGDEKGGEETSIGVCQGATCASVEKDCGPDGAADVILDAKGNAIEVICYRQDVQIEDVTIDEVAEASAGNNTVLVLDGKADGDDVSGDVTIEGNNAVVYGAGPDVSVIGGTLNVEKNSSIVRGVRIRGDVTITKNNTKLVFCAIEGDLTITGNNTTVAECDVYGKVTITGENTVLVQNRLQGTSQVSGYNLECNANMRFDDADRDFTVSDEELGGEVTCSKADGSPRPQKEKDEVTTSDAGI